MASNHNHIVHPFVSLLRIGFGLLVMTAIVTQLISTIQLDRSVTNFFSFFTIESNILAAIVLLVVGFGGLAGVKAHRTFAFLRGGATLYMVITGIVFALLLAGLEQRLQTTIPWVNTILHHIMPIVMIVDWLLFPPNFKFTFRQTLWWLIFPLAYLAYTLIRGPFVGWYPYPFLDVPQVGWPYVIGMSLLIAAGAAILAWILALRTGYKVVKR